MATEFVVTVERSTGNAEVGEMNVQPCACLHRDAYDCWLHRYNLSCEGDVEDDGGPCECPCHDEWREGEWI